MTESSITSGSVNKIRKNEKTAFIFLWAAAAITVLTLIAIVGSVLINGIGHLSLDFLTKEPENMGKD
ncbi:MAG: hypothetical protein PHI04_08095, partial [Clostridiaceae bacterium]|nr:hypothetical protein [Clostridiaceae bacterium]